MVVPPIISDSTKPTSDRIAASRLTQALSNGVGGAPTRSDMLDLLSSTIMIVYGFELVQEMLEQDGYLFKLLANDSGVAMFPYTTEHHDATQPGIRYAEESKGNALAAMVKPGRVEFRQHREFTDERVKLLWQRIIQLPEMAFALESDVTYQGRSL